MSFQFLSMGLGGILFDLFNYRQVVSVVAVIIMIFSISCYFFMEKLTEDTKIEENVQ